MGERLVQNTEFEENVGEKELGRNQTTQPKRITLTSRPLLGLAQRVVFLERLLPLVVDQDWLATEVLAVERVHGGAGRLFVGEVDETAIVVAEQTHALDLAERGERLQEIFIESLGADGSDPEVAGGLSKREEERNAVELASWEVERVSEWEGETKQENERNERGLAGWRSGSEEKREARGRGVSEQNQRQKLTRLMLSVRRMLPRGVPSRHRHLMADSGQSKVMNAHFDLGNSLSETIDPEGLMHCWKAWRNWTSEMVGHTLPTHTQLEVFCVGVCVRERERNR